MQPNQEDDADLGIRRRGSAWVVAALLGLATLGGCGVSVDAPQCSFFSNTCNPTVGPVTDQPVAAVYPQRLTVQAGAAASFSVNTNVANASFQWRRSADGGSTFTDIPGATSVSYALANARLSDDGALFQADVRNNGVSVVVAYAGRLAVSSLPGVVFQDAEFQPAAWAASAVVTPAASGATHTEEQASTGGNSGTYRRMVHAWPKGTDSLRVFNSALASGYDPSSLGAIYVIDFSEDCIVSAASASPAVVASNLLVEQGGRRYVASGSNACFSTAWAPLAARMSLGAADLVLVDGPACGAGESCPDFSAGAAPLRFGYVRDVNLATGAAAGSIEHGIDNWKVTVWRR
jgi:hypothetical protein